MSGVQVFHLTASALTVQRWRGSALVEAFAFDANTEGLEQFAAYLATRAGVPALMLADLVEEEFVTESVPRAFGRERRQLHARRAERLFRATPLRTALKQGRQREGRRDDRVLFSALTHPGAVMPWMEKIAQSGVPLQALSSVPHVSATLPRLLGIGERELLMVTPSADGLRQTYFEAGEVRASRLSPFVADPDAVMEELVRTRRYLQNGGMLSTGSELHVYLLADEPLLPEFERIPLPDGLALRLCSLEDVAGRLGISHCSMGASVLFAGLFLRAPGNRYALAPHLHGRDVHRARVAMEWASLAIALALSVLATFASLHALAERRSTLALESELARNIELADRTQVDPLPDDLTPDQLRSSVEGAERIARLEMRPDQALARLGEVLKASPEIELSSIDWTASLDGNFRDDASVSGSPMAADGSTGLHLPYHRLAIEARVAVRGGNLRAASEAAEELLAHFKGMPEVISVGMPSKPIDPDGRLKGSAGRSTSESLDLPFSMQVVFRP